MQNDRATLDKRRADVQRMFDAVAHRYDLMNSIMSLGQDRAWRRATVDAIAPRPGEHVLDLAAGTAKSSAAIAERGARVTAADLSYGMLHEGRANFPFLDFVNADGMALPFEDDTFDAVTISYGLRNIEDTTAALREMLRVTRPGGRLVVNEFSTPTHPAFRSLYTTYLPTALPLMARLSSNRAAYEYLAESILAWPDQRTLAGLMTAAGWVDVEWRDLTGGIVALHRARKA
ncbi:demethylmenaquinone methyltransferase [Tessaracoccus lapidicaptus]|uniref:demethylmenaquinone methyltransferase n=1 Tax=Tessaracoccus lapidicaptus TaxID=1427523 RepID=UPI00333EF430